MYLDKAKIKQSFALASATYDGVAVLQRTVGTALIDTLSSTGILLDLGCGTGFLTVKLTAIAQSVIALDIALPMLHVTKKKLADTVKECVRNNFNNVPPLPLGEGWGEGVNYLCADAEQLPLAEHSVDSVVSNLALQWCVNLEAVFTDIKRVLKPGGQLIFSIFGPQTLQELKAAWATADDYQHVNDFYSVQQLTGFLESAGFTEITVESQFYYPSYGSVLALMKELKQIGAHNVIAGRNKNITTKSRMQQMIEAYGQCGGMIYATFEVIMVKAS